MESNLNAHLNEGQSASRGSPFAVSRERSRPLAPDETKYEQARLLTLLRSINPVTVVDQICKAVAYFGGIPGAPPPEDGIFPESANTRETGALFIGWLAEIFPDLTAKSPEVSKEVGPAGSKKKGRPTKTNNKITAGAAASGEARITHEPPNSRNGYGYGPAVSAPAWGLPQSLALVNTPAATLPAVINPIIEQAKQYEQTSPNTPAKQPLDDSTESASKRRRGRPKGSRNKGRPDGQQGSEAANNQADSQAQEQVPESPETQVSVAKVAQMNAPSAPSFTPVQNSQAATATKPAQGLQYNEQSWQSNAQPAQVNNTSTGPVADEFSPEERAVLEAFRQQNTDGMSLMPSPVVPVKAGPEAGQKRKRPPPKPKPTPAPIQNFQTASPQPVQNSIKAPANTNNEASMGMAKDALQWGPVDTTTAAAPPTKRPRQRKPKPAVTNEPPSRTQTASVVSSATPPIPPSTIPDSQATASQQSIPQCVPVSRPPAEGLEAHYERFANLQHQQNGRSHTPTIPHTIQIPQQQIPQQQVRQSSKPSPAPLQQTIPQTQQMQHQKSQQGNQQNSVIQRDEQKLSQVNSTRPASTAFYNQRSQSSNAYSQQYPSHQPSQLYGSHQASPQMSNNSYRTNSTHTLAQASPQFSQSENTYKTASPHTIAQPSPSFSQPDTTTRNTNTNYLAQPSPSFSQAENPYRTPSTHSMAQPTPSYTASRSHSQTQQNSHQNPYGHFSDSSYIDLPTLESLGHAGGSSNSSVGLSTGYGQGMSVGLGNTSRSAATNSNSLYGSSSGLSNAFDTRTNDLLQGVSRSASHSNTAYGSTSSGLSNTFDTGSEHDMRDRLMRGLGRR
jgi:hypothetical protein